MPSSFVNKAFSQKLLIYSGLRLFVFVLLIIVLCLPSTAAAATLPSGFTETTVASGMSSPTALASYSVPSGAPMGV